MPQLTPQELQEISRLVGHEKETAKEAWRRVNKSRRKNKVDEVDYSAVTRFVKGETHDPTKAEARGRKPLLAKADVRSAEKARKRLVREADNDHRVTYSDVMEESGLEDKAGQRTLERRLREQGVAYRKGREKIQIDAADAKARNKQCKDWIKRRKGFWANSVHGFVDNKRWLLPLSPKQKKRYRQTKVIGHLRLKGEGKDRGFTRPRQKHSWMGVPSVEVTAMVAKDRVVLWHYHTKTWCGQVAADTYKGPILSALRRAWGPRRKYVLVEDGDTKGNQSRKGLEAKEGSGIKAMVLPPRTPSLMPLDAAVWQRIEERMIANDPGVRETRPQYLTRLRKTAKSLPKGFVAGLLQGYKSKIQEILDAKGWHPKGD